MLSALLFAAIGTPVWAQHARTIRASAHLQVPALQALQRLSEQRLPDGTRRVSVQVSSNQAWYVSLDSSQPGGWQWRIEGDVAFRNAEGASVLAVAGDAVHRHTLTFEVRGTGEALVKVSVHPVTAGPGAVASSLAVAR